MKILENIFMVLAVVFGVLSTICSAIILRYTPIVTIVLVILELLSITTYGVWIVIGYGLLVFFGALLILGTNALLLSILGRK